MGPDVPALSGLDGSEKCRIPGAALKEAADLHGDGRPEFVFSANSGQLFAVNGEDASVAYSLDLGHPVGNPIVADVNGDGLAEVLFVCDSTLYCLASGQAARP